MAHSFFTTFFNSFLLFLILAGSIELRFHDGKAAASQPSASARARANRLLAAKRPNHAKCPQSMTSCPIAPIVVQSKSLQSRLVNKQKMTWECLDLEQELTACGRCDNDVNAFVDSIIYISVYHLAVELTSVARYTPFRDTVHETFKR
jgi:hypothetical protein